MTRFKSDMELRLQQKTTAKKAWNDYNVSFVLH